MTFIEAALSLLRQAGRPLHFKELTERAIQQNLLSHVGRTPEQSMQTCLAQETKKGSATVVVRVKPGVFGLRSYEQPELAPTPQDKVAVAGPPGEKDANGKTRRRRRGRGRKAAGELAPTGLAAEGAPEAVAAVGGEEGSPTGWDELSPAPEASRAASLPEDLPSLEDLANEYADDLRAVAGEALIAGDVIDEKSADEDRPMLEPIKAVRGERDRRGRRKGRSGKPAAAKEPAAARPARHAPRAERAAAPRAPQAPPVAVVPIVRAEAPRPLPLREAQAPLPAPIAMGQASLAETAYQLLRSMSDPRPVHARQLAAMAAKRRLVTGEQEDLWRAFKAALLTDTRARQAKGRRPRIRHHGGGLFAVATHRLEAELLGVEADLDRQAVALETETKKALGRRVAKLPLPALTALARTFLEEAGFRSLTPVKSGPGVTYLAATAPPEDGAARVLVAVRSGEEAIGRRAVGELRAGVLAKSLDSGLLVAAADLANDGVAELGAAPPPVDVLSGEALAAELERLGVGVIRCALPVSYLDPAFFAELTEG